MADIRCVSSSSFVDCTLKSNVIFDHGQHFCGEYSVSFFGLSIMARSYGSFNERGDPERGRLLDDVRTQSVLNRRTSVHSQSGLLGGGGSSGHEDRYSDEDESTARHAARGSSSRENGRRGSASGISIEESDGESYAIPISPVAGRRGSAGSSTLSISNSEELQEGVRKMEAISRTWTQKTLVIAYLG